MPILNRYGSREMGATACQFQAGAPLTVSRPWSHVEVVDDAGRPAQTGRILVTSTVCRGTPFLRYQMEDIVTVDPDGADEAGIRGLAQIDGRLAGMLDLPNGRRISNLFWNHGFKEFPEIQQFQVTLRVNDTVQLYFRGAGFSPAREREIRQALGHLLDGVSYDMAWVERIPLTSRGKLLQVINEKTTAPASGSPTAADPGK